MIFQMPARIAEATRDGVIDSWLSGDSRRITGIKYGISEAAVSDIVGEYRRQQGPQRADMLRAFAVTLSKTGITADQCAQGHRLIMMMKGMGAVGEMNYEGFLTDISKRYVEAGRDPIHLFEHINELHSFLDRNRGRYEKTSVSQIDEIVKRKEEEDKKLNEGISALRSQEKELERRITALQFPKAEVETELQWDRELVQTLKSKGLQFETVPRFVSALILMKERG